MTVDQKARYQGWIHQLCKGLARAASHDDLDTLRRFLNDLLTYSELCDLAKRWAAACECIRYPEKSDRQIAKELGINEKTVKRARQWVNPPDYRPRGGFRDVYELLYQEQVITLVEGSTPQPSIPIVAPGGKPS